MIGPAIVPADGISGRDLLDIYCEVADIVLPYLSAVSVKRTSPSWISPIRQPDGIGRVEIAKKGGTMV